MFTPKFSSTDGSFSSNFHKYEIIKGEDGFSPIVEAVPIENGYQITITDKDKTISFELTNGQDGQDGKTPFFKSEGDQLLISYDKENWIAVGRIKGDKGDTGNGIASVIFEEDYRLTLVFDNLTSFTTPSLRGPKGNDGQNGKDGKGIKEAYINDNGTLTLLFDDDSSFTTEISIIGRDGQDGKDGQDGVTPIKGEDYFTETEKEGFVNIIREESIGNIQNSLEEILQLQQEYLLPIWEGGSY